MSFLFITLVFLALLGMGMSDKCPDGTPCEKDHPCCPIKGQFACCPLHNGVCCPNNRHCCPEGTTCSHDGEGCLNVGDGQDYQDDSPYDEDDYHYCPDGAACPIDGTTCCLTASGNYACCPFENGVCCEDMETCCQQGQKCEGGKCVDA